MNTIKQFCTASYEAQLYYEVYGEGEPIVLLHGNGEDHRYFSKQIPVLKKQYQVFAPDTRAHGKSTPGTAPLNFDLFADDVIAILDDAGLSKAHLLGFSDGGNTALHVALKYPDRVSSLIIDGANLFPEGMTQIFRDQVASKYTLLCDLAKKEPRMRPKAELYGLMVHHPHLTPQRLQKITVPVLVIAGEFDLVETSHTELIAQSIPNSQLFIVADGDHFLASQMPAVFNALVIDFLHEASPAK